ncbi:MAG: hypothetical protein ACFFEE_09960 [Candidatus Thorarchaeota archaeon]
MFDIGGDNVTDVVIVSVIDGTLPVIDSPSDIEYEQFTTGHVRIWNPSNVHPASYSILRNGIILGSGGWNGSSVYILADWLVPGQYNFTLVITDIGGNWVSDTVTVIVTSTTTPTEPATMTNATISDTTPNTP